MTENKDLRKVIQLNVDDLVRIELEEEDDFLKVRETLTRIGVSSRKEKTLFQSCHILHKKGKYYIVHFKELFALDGKPTNFDENDIARRNTIVNLLAEWGLISLADAQQTKDPTVSLNQIKIIPYRDKPDWNLESKYNIGKRRF
jgi:hypothetical protein